METKELKELAQARGLSAIKKRPTGPVTVLESKTGKLIGVFSTADEALSTILTFPILPPIDPRPVAWTVISQATADPIRCPNGYGPNCMCMDDTFLYLCAVGPCPNKAECNGTCRGHFSQLRVFGDLTKAAIKKTDEYHAEGKPLKVFPALLPLKMVRTTGKDWSTLTPAEVNKATDGVIGMAVKYTGTEYVLLDKDGHVLDRVATRAELIDQEQED